MRKLKFREGANREKLTLKKIINKEILFFHRLRPLQTVKKSAPNREEIGTKNPPFFHR